MTEHWYIVTAATSPVAHLSIYGRIGEGLFEDGTPADRIVADLDAITASELHVHVNSPGGNVWDGLAMANALTAHPARVTTHIEGVAASIASVVALAADEVIIAENAMMMIHDPYTIAQGTADDMRAAAGMLDRITSALVATYTARSTMTADEVRAAMAAETWFSADEALSVGFADSKENSLPIAAMLDNTLRKVDAVDAPTITPPAAPPAAAPPIPTPAPVNVATREDIATLEARIAALADLNPRPEAHPLAQYRTVGEYHRALLDGTAPLAALFDQVTTDNPGVMPPVWSQQVHGIVERARVAVNAFGVEPAGDAGMTFNWPYFAGDLAAIVEEQEDEKDEVNSVQISLLKGSANLATYAAGSDISFQLLQRSTPAYLNAHARIMAAAYGITTDNAFADALWAAGTASAVDYAIGGDTTGAALRSALFTNSVEVEDATGLPAEFVLVATDVFKLIGGMTALQPEPYGTFNVPGTATASSLRVNVNGLVVKRERNLPDGAILVSNSEAAKWIEDGPRLIDAVNVAQLGQDVAIYGYGATAVYSAAGLVKLTNLP